MMFFRDKVGYGCINKYTNYRNQNISLFEIAGEIIRIIIFQSCFITPTSLKKCDLTLLYI